MFALFRLCVTLNTCRVEGRHRTGRSLRLRLRHHVAAGGPPYPRQLPRRLVRGELHLQPPHRRVLQHGVERALPSHATLPHAPPQTLRR